GTYRMGSDRHYPEEAPTHRVSVDGFWIDRTPVTNRQFRKFVEATGYVTFAEIAPNLEDYPGALPHMLVDVQVRRQLAPPLWQRQLDPRPRRSSSRAHRLSRCRGLCRMGRQGIADG